MNTECALDLFIQGPSSLTPRNVANESFSSTEIKMMGKRSGIYEINLFLHVRQLFKTQEYSRAQEGVSGISLQCLDQILTPLLRSLALHWSPDCLDLHQGFHRPDLSNHITVAGVLLSIQGHVPLLQVVLKPPLTPAGLPVPVQDRIGRSITEILDQPPTQLLNYLLGL